jgi:hypothetical protein
VLSTEEVRVFRERAPRCKISVAVVCAPAETGEVLEAELVNLSTSGMFVATAHRLEVGTVVAFKFTVDEGLVALSGSAEVARIGQEPGGLGFRFLSLDQGGTELVARLVAVGEGSAAEELAGIEYGPGSVRVRLSRETARLFTYNPLLHIGVGGCFLPTERDVPHGAGFQVDILDDADVLILRCKAKVAAKQDRRIGLRLIDVERPALQALRAHVARLSSPPSASR